MLHEKNTKQQLAVRVSFDSTDRPHEFYTTFVCQKPSVQDALCDEFKHWCCENPVLIDAGTGRGKTTFVYTTLLPDALQRGQTLLLISNRLALSVQQKLEICRCLDSPLEKLLTDEGLRQQEDFGPVKVITYHKLPAFLQNTENSEWLKNLRYVVFDECHFFTSDSLFNDRCDYYLKLATTRFCHSIRVYLTATSWDVAHPLADAEFKNYKGPGYPFFRPLFREFYRYYFPQSYDNTRIHFFNQLSELTAAIEKDHSTKWLFFVDNRETGKSFAKNLGERAMYFDADSKDKTQWVDLLNAKQFQEQVLVTTPVLDCGVNIWDDAVKHVVLTTDDHVRFIQELGRKRRKSGEVVDLWVQKPSAKKIASRVRDCQKYLEWLRQIESCTGDFARCCSLADTLRQQYDPQINKLFRLHNGYIFPNALAKHHLQQRVKFLSALNAGEVSFEESVYEWLGLEVEEDPAIPALEKFYIQNIDTPISPEQQQHVRQLIIAACRSAGYPEPRTDRFETMKVRALNHRLASQGLCYRLEDTERGWILNKEVTK